jgi:two-component system chemotaxis response regulator CheY
MKIEELKFLVVDDFSTMRRIVRGLLREIGCSNVLEAEDGAKAIALLADANVDVILSDINMPNMNGFELLKAVKSSESLKHIPVVLVTAEARKDDILMAVQAGASGYIVKPFNRTTLETKVRKVVGGLIDSASGG